MKIARRSNVWLYFYDYGRDRAKCRFCSTIFSTKGGSTTTLRRHISSKHTGGKVAPKSTDSFLNYLLKLKEEKVNEENNVILFDDCSREILPSEIIIENVDLIEDSQNNIYLNEENGIILTAPKEFQKKEISQQNVSFNEQLISSKSRNSNKKLETLTTIANSLDKMATSFELIADFLCSNVNNNKSTD